MQAIRGKKGSFQKVIIDFFKLYFITLEYFKKSLVRSSGAGGSNVNSVSTKVEIRFNAVNADWLENDIREFFIKKNRHKINKLGEFCIASDKTRYAVSQFICLY
jgi:protein subunit release factor B